MVKAINTHIDNGTTCKNGCATLGSIIDNNGKISDKSTKKNNEMNS